MTDADLLAVWAKRRLLWGIAYQRTRDADAADDVVSETIIKLLERRNEARAPMALAIHICRHAALDALRRAVVRSGDALLTPRDAAPQDEAHEAIARVNAERALSVLPADVRAAIYARYYLGCDRATIARRMDMSVRAVEHRIARGLTLMRRELLGSVD
jgi:RNA polymerase sigma factor (sigma-70 family)